MLLVLGWPMVLVLPKEKVLFWVVVAEPNGLKRLEACCCGWPNKLPVVVPNAPVPVMQTVNTYIQDTHTKKKKKQFLRYNHLLVPNEVLVWPKLKPVFGADEPKSPVPVLGVAAAVGPKRPPVPAAMGLEGPFLPAW